MSTAYEARSSSRSIPNRNSAQLRARTRASARTSRKNLTGSNGCFGAASATGGVRTGEPRGRNELNVDSGCNPEGKSQDQDPGHRQKENQNKGGDDPLAA